MRHPETLGPNTLCVRATSAPITPGQPLSPSPVFTSTYHALPSGEEGDFYGRNSNPTWRDVERVIAVLEKAEHATIFPTGMGAITCLLRALCRGGSLLVPADGYYLTRVYATQKLAHTGVDVRTARCGDFVAAIADMAKAPAPRIVLAETPVNPTLDVLDLQAAVEAARAVEAIFIVDNTAATPFGQNPLEYGADISLAAATKGLCGHSDITLGYVANRRNDLADAVLQERTITGTTTGPMEAWLAHRSLATAALRFDRQCSNAQAVAEFLQTQPAVNSVRYPGLTTDPSHSLAATQMRRYGSLVSLELSSQAAAEEFLTHSALISQATSFGGLHSTADRRERWGDNVAEGFLRVSLGIEDEKDLIADVSHALESLSPRT